MTKARRLLAVAAVLAAAAVVSSSPSWGDPGERKDRGRLLPERKGPLAGAAAAVAPDAEAALVASKCAQGVPLTYQTADGETLFALQVQPALEAARPRPRDYLIMICTSA